MVDESESIDMMVIPLSICSQDLESIQSIGQDLNLTEGEVIKTAINYLSAINDMRKEGKFFAAKVPFGYEFPPYVIPFEPKPVLKTYGPVKLSASS